MEVSVEGIEFIKKHEGKVLTGYLDPIGVPTIGYGHIKTAVLGKVITEKEAENLLRKDVREAERAVNFYVLQKGYDLTDNQFDALVSLVFNVGPHNIFTRVYNNGYPVGSSLYNLIKLGQYKKAGERFKDFNKAGGKVLPGLVKRRKEESELFLKKKRML